MSLQKDQSNPDDDRGIHGCNRFSIRDYVFSARQKDISHNWPFLPEYLQVCMRHGVSRVLPSFDPRNFSRNREYLDSLHRENACTNIINNSFMGINGDDKLFGIGREAYISEAVSEVSKQVCSLSLSENRNQHGEDKNRNKANKDQDLLMHPVVEVISTSEDSATDVLEIPPPVLESTDKYVLLGGMISSMPIIREIIQISDGSNDEPFLGNKPESGWTENFLNPDVFHSMETTSSLNLISEADQPLSTLPSAKRSKHKLKKRKGKPKKRSMVDICAKARSCTLEDLDRINGSNWAIDSSLMPYGNLAFEESKSFVDEGNGKVVYVDGCDYRIQLPDGFRQRKHPRDENVGSSNLLGKRRRIMMIKLQGCKVKK